MPSRELQQLQQLQRVKAFAGAKVKYRANRTQSSMLELLRCSRYSRQSRNVQCSMVNFPRALRARSVSLPFHEHEPASL